MAPRPGLVLVVAVLAMTLAAGPCAAQADKDFLRSEFWADLEPVAGVGEEWPVSPEEARKRILAEAAWVFGGMIWGFEFTYTPYDKTRAIQESFDIVPIESLAAAAPALSPETSPSAAAQPRAISSGQLFSYAEYRPEAALVALMHSYANDPWRGSQGIGKADMNLGVKGRRAAYVDGLRASVRSYLQGIEPNKPRLVKGRVVFDRPPSLEIIGGYYTAQVRARLMVIESLPYRIY